MGLTANAASFITPLAYPTPMDRNLFVCDLESKKNIALTTGPGTHRIELNA
jgi:dipeptidyl-peptidase-4